MKYNFSAICETGRVRLENQDRIYVNGMISNGEHVQMGGTGKKQGLFAVADGMGGEAQGAQAAQFALSVLPIKRSWSADAVLRAYAAGNGVICEEIRKIRKRTGATLTTLLLTDDDQASIANIGDSRCYLYRDNCLAQLSEDHTVVQRLIALGFINSAQAKTHPERHRLTQHLGIFPEEIVIQPHAVRLSVKPSDRFLLCSDGLTDMLEDGEICEILHNQETAPRCTAALYQRAMQRGGKDNISVILVTIEC